MKKTIILIAAVLLAALFAPTAEARCGTNCLRIQIKDLRSEVRGLENEVGKLASQVADTRTRAITAQQGAVAADNKASEAAQKIGTFIVCTGSQVVSQYAGYTGLHPTALDLGDDGLPLTPTLSVRTNLC